MVTLQQVYGNIGGTEPGHGGCKEESRTHVLPFSIEDIACNDDKIDKTLQGQTTPTLPAPAWLHPGSLQLTGPHIVKDHGGDCPDAGRLRAGSESYVSSLIWYAAL